MALDPQAFKAVMGQWPSGVTVVTTTDADGSTGMTASSFSSVSLSPPLISVCIARHLPTHARLSQSRIFAVNILSKNQVEDGLRFSGQLRDVTDRFDGIAVTTAVTGAPLLRGTLGWLDCRVWAMHDGGDHTIFVGEVLEAGIDRTAAPLLYHSRSWGQFADVLAREATVALAGSERDATILANAFGARRDRPDDLDTIVARVKAVLAHGPARLLILDDAAGAADPLLLRLVIQAIAGLVGRAAVGLRPAAGPMALANVLVGLKSGVHYVSGSAGCDGPFVAIADVRAMLARMGVAMREG